VTQREERRKRGKESAALLSLRGAFLSNGTSEPCGSERGRTRERLREDKEREGKPT